MDPKAVEKVIAALRQCARMEECSGCYLQGYEMDRCTRMLHDGYRECIRVLKPDGVLIFKWAETDIPAADVWKAIGEKPLFGHHSGKRSMTFWGCYMKLEDESCVGTSLISRAKLMGELTKADAQKRYREMTGEEVYAAVLTLVNDMPDE